MNKKYFNLTILRVSKFTIKADFMVKNDFLIAMSSFFFHGVN